MIGQEISGEGIGACLCEHVSRSEAMPFSQLFDLCSLRSRYRVPLRNDYKYYAIIKGIGEEQAVDSPDIM